MDFYELIKNRESVRNYNPDKQIDQSILERILEAGRLAPSGANLQPWKFIIVSSPQILSNLRQVTGSAWFSKAPHVLAVIANNRETEMRNRFGNDTIETDLAITMTHMLLAAEWEGVSACWIGAFNSDIAAQALKLDKDQYVYALASLGYPPKGFEKHGRKQRKSFEEVVTFL